MLDDSPPLRVFCSYSHKDEALRERFDRHVAGMKRSGLVSVWNDREITAGGEWGRVIDVNLKAADIILLLVSSDFIASDYCWNIEVTEAMYRHEAGMAVVIPVFLRPCDFEGTPFAALQGAPRDARPITKWGNRDEAWVDVVKAIRKAARELLVRRRASSPILYQSILGHFADSETVSVRITRVDIGRLPRATGTLFGRSEMFEHLDRLWADPAIGVAAVVAEGGTGKSVLVSRWLDQVKDRRWDGAERVFGWSFYSQGSDRQASADEFLDAALDYFDPHGRRPNSAWDKGIALAGLMAGGKCLLVLDGLEPLQYGEAGMRGRLKDQGMQALLRGLARRGHPGLCLITSRLPLADLARWQDTSVAALELGTLSDAAGADLLAARGVLGSPKELEALSAEFGGHGLALALLAEWLVRHHRGDFAAAGRLRPHRADAGRDDHAIRVLEAVVETLNPAEAAVMGMIGLFDRPAGPRLIAALRADPPIVGLSDALAAGDWPALLAGLRAARLLLAEEHDGALDAHPVVRQFFGTRLKQTAPQAWRDAHCRLFDTLCAMAPKLPDTLGEMEPLFQSIRHGVEAGRAQGAFNDVLRARIDRGNKHFTARKWGAYGARLAALAALFDPPWTHPVAGLSPADQSFVLGDAGYGLRAVGRPGDALAPMQAALAGGEAAEDWTNAAIRAANLSEVQLLRGDVAAAVDMGRRAIGHADTSGDEFRRMGYRTTLADALAQSGEVAAARAAFVEAEAMQQAQQPDYPILYSVQGYRYCDLLLAAGEWVAVRDRASRTQGWAKQQGILLDIALDTLSLGCAAHQAARAGQGDWDMAADLLNEAVANLRRAGSLDDLPRGLLARAGFRLERKDWDGAADDIDEAREIAETGGMRLFLADVLLMEVRLALARNQADEAHPILAKARAEIAATGYHRRDTDVAELDARLTVIA